MKIRQVSAFFLGIKVVDLSMKMIYNHRHVILGATVVGTPYTTVPQRPLRQILSFGASSGKLHNGMIAL